MREDRGQGGVLLASEARTASVNSPAVTNVCGGQNLRVDIDVSAVVDTPSVVFTVAAYDPGSGTWIAVLASAAQTGAGHVTLRISPHLTASANLIAKDFAPRLFRVQAVHGDTDEITYSVSFSLT